MLRLKSNNLFHIFKCDLNRTSERNGKSKDSQEHLNQLWKLWQSPKPSELEKISLLNDVNEILADNRIHLVKFINILLFVENIFTDNSAYTR